SVLELHMRHNHIPDHSQSVRLTQRLLQPFLNTLIKDDLLLQIFKYFKCGRISIKKPPEGGFNSYG
ncbi:MAG: hypothetical protein RSE38_03515, partial [Acinetobacter sp.]